MGCSCEVVGLNTLPKNHLLNYGNSHSLQYFSKCTTAYLVHVCVRVFGSWN